jgi:hypothetical protein
MSRKFYGILCMVVSAILGCVAIWVVEGWETALIIFSVSFCVIVFFVACDLLGVDFTI